MTSSRPLVPSGTLRLSRRAFLTMRLKPALCGGRGSPPPPRAGGRGEEGGRGRPDGRSGVHAVSPKMPLPDNVDIIITLLEDCPKCLLMVEVCVEKHDKSIAPHCKLVCVFCHLKVKIFQRPNDSSQWLECTFLSLYGYMCVVFVCEKRSLKTKILRFLYAFCVQIWNYI